MGQIHDIRVKIEAYVKDLDKNINDSVLSVKDDLVNLNKEQMLSSRGNDDKPLIHSRTGSPNLSKQYAKRTNKTKPNIYLNGQYQSDLTMHPSYKLKIYKIDAPDNRLEKYLPSNYKNLQGVAPSNKQKAFAITNTAIAKSLKSKVFNG